MKLSIGWARRVIACRLAVLFAAFAVAGATPPASASPGDDRALIEQWLERDAASIVMEVLSRDPDWFGDLGLTDPGASIGFSTLHRFPVVSDVPDYDLRGDRVRGEATIAANVDTQDAEYCALVVVGESVTDTAVCAIVTGGVVENTSIREMDFAVDTSIYDQDVDFLVAGPFGMYAALGTRVVPLDGSAVYHVGRSPVAETVFFSAMAKRDSERRVIEDAAGEEIAGGYPPLLADSDPDATEAWDEWVEESMGVLDARSEATGEVNRAPLIALIVAALALGVSMTFIYRARRPHPRSRRVGER